MNKELLEELKLLIEEQTEEQDGDNDLITYEEDPNHEERVYRSLGYGGFRKRILPNADKQGY